LPLPGSVLGFVPDSLRDSRAHTQESNIDMGDLIRDQHEMEAAGSSQGVYGSVAAANAAAKTQIDQFMRH
jgi:hypothetical protein